jgi:hypothetical protein
MAHPRPGPGILERTDVELGQEEMAHLWPRADERATRLYRMCGRVLRLRCDSREYARRFENAFRRLRLEAAPVSEPTSEVTFLTRHAGPGGCPALLDRVHGRVRVFDHEEVLPTQLFFCLAFLEKDMFPLPDRIILHASVVEHGGKVTALVGLTNSGKTTLGLRLALEPHTTFLSDEYCPVRLGDGLVEPFPRCLSLRQYACNMLRERGALYLENVPGADFQAEVDPLSIRGITLGNGGPLRNVVLLSGQNLPDPGNDDVRLLDLQFVSPSLLADLQSVAGVRAVKVLDRPVGSGIAVQVEGLPGSKITEELIRVCRDVHKLELFGFLSPGASRPDFISSPILTALQPLPGIIELTRYLVNSRELRSQFGGSLPGLIDCLAARLGQVRFFSLQPGPLEETTRLVRNKVLET